MFCVIAKIRLLYTAEIQSNSTVSVKTIRKITKKILWIFITPTASASIGTCRGRTKQNCLTLSKSEAILRKVLETNNMVT